MFLATIFTALLLLLPTHGAWAMPQPIDEFTLEKAHREMNSDETTCRWVFQISRPDYEQQMALAAWCDFSITTASGESCSAASFANVECRPGTDWGKDWVVNAGHSDYGDFMIVVVRNVRVGAVAYFGFSREDLESGRELPKQVEDAYPVTSLSAARRGPSDDVDPADLQVRMTGEEQLAGAPEWTVERMLRCKWKRNVAWLGSGARKGRY
jgi:hypothetical protein